MRVVAEGGGGKIASWSRDTTDPDLLGKKAGDSVEIDGITAYLRCMRKVGRLRGK